MRRQILPMCSLKLLFKYLHTGTKSIIFRWPKAPIQKRINGILFEFDFDLDPLTKLMHNPLKLFLKYFNAEVNPSVLVMYHGAYEISTIEIMRKLLNKDDTFIDVGANIGYLSAIAMGFVGKTGQVHSFEPVPKYFKRLKDLAVANKEYKIVVNQYALGDKEETLRIDITGLAGIGMSTMILGLRKKKLIEETIKVPVCRLDRYIKEKNVGSVSLIKIDVEGFEFPVLKGLSGYFKTGHHPAIICEITPVAYPLLGYSLGQLSKYMEKHNYHAFSFDNAKIDVTKLKEQINVVFYYQYK